METYLTLIKENSKKLILLAIILLLVFLGTFFLKNYQKKLDNKISENYIKAGIFLATNKKEDSKKMFVSVVESQHNFYSGLALNSIIENKLETNNDEVLRLFEIVEQSIDSKEQKDLIKFKKALFFLKASKKDAGTKLLIEIIDSNSIWKEAASETLKSNK